MSNIDRIIFNGTTYRFASDITANNVAGFVFGDPVTIANGQVPEDDPTWAYCAWPYNTAIYDSTNNTICVFYAAKTKHTSNDGAWVMKRLSLDTNTWSKPIVVESSTTHANYGFAVAIDDDGNYVGFYKDKQGTGKLYKAISTDKGDTWTSEPFLIDDVHQSGADACSLKKTSTGRWLMYIGNNSGGNAAVAYSDDLTNWSKVMLTNTDGNNYEADWVELLNGKIVLIVRSGVAGAVTGDIPKMFISEDNGSSWTYKGEMNGLDSRNAPVSIYRNPVDNLIYLFHHSRKTINGKARWYVTPVTDFDLENNNIGKNYCVWQKIVKNTADMGYGAIVSDGQMRLHWFFYLSQSGEGVRIMHSVIDQYTDNSF